MRSLRCVLPASTRASTFASKSARSLTRSFSHSIPFSVSLTNNPLKPHPRLPLVSLHAISLRYFRVRAPDYVSRRSQRQVSATMRRADKRLRNVEWNDVSLNFHNKTRRERKPRKEKIEILSRTFRIVQFTIWSTNKMIHRSLKNFIIDQFTLSVTAHDSELWRVKKEPFVLVLPVNQCCDHKGKQELFTEEFINVSPTPSTVWREFLSLALFHSFSYFLFRGMWEKLPRAKQRTRSSRTWFLPRVFLLFCFSSSSLRSFTSASLFSRICLSLAKGRSCASFSFNVVAFLPFRL